MKKTKAFTLTEIILVVALIAIILIAIYPYIRSIRETWTYSDRRSEILQHARVALDKIVRDIRNAKRITEIDTSIISPGQFIEIINQDYDTVTIFHNVDNDNEKYIEPQGDIQDNDLVVQTEDREGNPVYNVLAKSVDYFRLYYLKDTMDPNDEAEDAEEVVAVRIDMRVSDPEGILTGTIPVTSLTYVRAPENIGIPGVWTIDYDNWDVVKLDLEDAQEIVRITSIVYPEVIAVDPRDGSCWISDSWHQNQRLVKFNKAGREIFRIEGRRVMEMTVDPTDGSCWIYDGNCNEILKLNPLDGSVEKRQDGTEIKLPVPYAPVHQMEINSSDNTCYLASNYGWLYKIDPEGNVLKSKRLFDGHWTVWQISVDSNDGSCWVASSGSKFGCPKLVKVSSDMETITEIIPADDINYRYIHGVAVDPEDSSCWVTATSPSLTKIDQSGNILISIDNNVGEQFLAVISEREEE